jgi:hypothetical protein
MQLPGIALFPLCSRSQSIYPVHIIIAKRGPVWLMLYAGYDHMRRRDAQAHCKSYLIMDRASFLLLESTARTASEFIL